ncbi:MULTISPECIES: glycosyltransferase [unclassified Paracoccus (in: a-proteobacteria)]|uniref:glycosyltransferase n=1 Tax=unclassified Paracoccus (in: a-proteobacteria) TaxID=2688777 RepID=UPI0012B3A53C|nr:MULTISPECIES: glycosyltransferase [unclassified Paracoccus (in: a-proteobacteria)]UXU75634.1 glycosyltransferase [Paracoccus sp. SMMA_5]UXU81539.1 glycosyltransferase [Paracoccus sp. SMMA_5_TC]
MTPTRLGAVAIGRNEGERLKACLRSLVGHCDPVVYVDSGSADDSVAFARDLGVIVVELDSAIPFTAARARNAGFQALEQAGSPELVQFVDGDCRVEPEWLQAGMAALHDDPRLGLVTGWRGEIHPTATVYNQMCEVDWRRPAGPITACGGDMMVRAAAFRQIGGFDPVVIAAEDDEFCLRLARAGWRLLRLPVQMTWHDADMTRFGQWWQRTIRNGHGFAQVGAMHPPYFRRERLRVWVYGLVLPLLGLLGLLVSRWLLLAVLAAYALSWWKTARGLSGRPMAWRQAGLLTLAKIPNLIGMLTFYRRRWLGRDMRIIEYK